IPCKLHFYYTLHSLLYSLTRPTPPHLPPFFFFKHTATTDISTLSLHDALPISVRYTRHRPCPAPERRPRQPRDLGGVCRLAAIRSEEHTSELQSLTNLVCRLLLEKKKKTRHKNVIKKEMTSIENDIT